MRDFDEVRIFPLGTLLVIASLVCGFVLVAGGLGFAGAMLADRTAVIESPGDHTIDAPDAGRYVVTVPDSPLSLDGDDRGPPSVSITVDSSVTEAVDLDVTGEPDPDFGRGPPGAWLEINNVRSRVVGTIRLNGGPQTVTLAGEETAFPVVVRRDPQNVLLSTGRIAAPLVLVPIALLVAGILICLRNAERRRNTEAAFLDQIA